jgi:hypothetical protein
VQAPLQRGEVDPSLVPADEFPVEHHVGVELGDGANDLREVPGERAALARLQSNRAQTAQRDAAASCD